MRSETMPTLVTTTGFKALQLNTRAYGLLLGLSTLIMLILRFHMMPNLAPQGDFGPVISGLCMAYIFILATTYSAFCFRIGICHPLVMAGWLCALFACLTLAAWLFVSGFIVPRLSDTMPPSIIQSTDLISRMDVKLGLGALSLAITFWSHALMHRKGSARLMAMIAFLVGAIGLVMVIKTHGPITIGTLTTYLVLLAGWNLSLAFWFPKGLVQ